MEFDDIIKRLEAAKGDPEAMILAAVDVSLDSHGSDLRTALEAAAVPHWFDTGIIAHLLDLDETTAEKLVDRLVQLPFVERFDSRKGWNVHEATRLALRRRLQQQQPKLLQQLSERAVEIFNNDEPAQRIESCFHHLRSEPDTGAKNLRQLYEEWRDNGRCEHLQALGLAVEELLATELRPLARARFLVVFGSIRRGRLLLKDAEANAREALELFKQLDDKPGQIKAHCQLGDVLQAQGGGGEIA